MQGVQMRWLKNHGRTVLQYRVKYDTTVRAGMWDNENIVKTAKYEWSDWLDVPTVDQQDT